MTTVDVTDNPELHRYEGRVDGRLAGFAEYQLTDELVVFTHTEVDSAYEGKGVGSAIARAALDSVRDAGTRKVLPVCAFILGYMRRHDEYSSLLYNARASTATD